MALASGDCPVPAPLPAGRYTMTYELSRAAFESLLSFWAAAVASQRGFDAAPQEPMASAVRARLRAAIAAGRMQPAAVLRIVRLPGHGLERRYALFVADPDSPPAAARVYVVYLSHRLAGAWRITAISDAAA